MATGLASLYNRGSAVGGLRAPAPVASSGGLGGLGGIGKFVGSNPIAQANDLAGQYQRAGIFDPYGSPRLRALRRRRALQLNASLRSRNAGAAQLYGLDPMQRRQAMVSQDIAGNAALSGGLSEADLQGEQEQAQFGRSLYMGNLDYARQRQLAKDQAKAQSQGGVGSVLGGLAGSFLGPLGTAAGGYIGGKIAK